MTEWWNDPQVNKQPSKVKTSKVDEFKKQTDKTKVGQAEAAIIPKVAGAIEAGSKKPILGAVINPAMRVLETFGKRVVQPLTQGASTALLTPQAMAAGKGNPIESFRFAKKQSEKISMGQALAGAVGKVTSPVLGDVTNATFLNEDFDIFNDKQRERAFRDEWVGIIASGSSDLVLAALGTKGAGATVRATGRKVVGPKRIATTDDMNKFRDEIETIVTESTLPDVQRTKTGLTVLVDDAVREKDITKLAANPLVSETANPYRTATIVSRLDNHRDVADYLLAERGDIDAFNRFFASKPLDADHLDDYGIDKTTPIYDWSELGQEFLTPAMTSRMQRIVDAKKASDPKFARALEEFGANLPRGVNVESYRPGRFAALESLSLAKKKIQLQSQYGDLKMFGDDGGEGWKTQVYQTNTYDRVIRTIAWTGSGRPQGMINISNPRAFEASSDLLSDLNRLQFLSGAEGAVFKRKMVSKFLNAQDDTERALALGQIEEAVMIRLAKFYGVTDLQDIRTPTDAVDQIKQWRTKANESRSTIKQFAVKNGFIPDNDGSINVQNFLSVSNEAQTIPMLDFRRLEAEVIINARRAAGKGTKVTEGQYRGAVVSKVAMNTGQFLDLANMVFSNLNLLRLAYIPKNSMIDPMARASMALESMELFRNAAPAMDNVAYNSSLRAESIKRFLPGSPQSKARKRAEAAKFEVEQYRAEMEPKVADWEKAQDAFDIADKNYAKLVAARDKALARANKSTGASAAKAQAALYAAEDALYDARIALSQADDQLSRTADIVNGYAKLIDNTRKDWIDYESRKQELRTGKKRIGQEQDVIVSSSGKAYTIDGLADPNIRGVGPYMAEVDSAQNFLTTAMQSEISRRLRADGTRFVKINRKDRAEYMNALAHIANRQIRNEIDMPLGMMMRNESTGEILKWLYSPAGKEYRLRMQSRFGGKELKRDDFANWIDTTRDKLFQMYPDDGLRSTILTREVSVDEVDSILYGKPDLPETIDGPSLQLNDLNNLERGLAKVQGATDAAWRILSAAENRLVRNPLFLTYTRQEMKTMVDAAERSGINVSDAVVNHEIRQAAYRKALSRVEETLYSSRRLSNGMYVARYAMSFPLAFFNSQAVALRLLARNPMNAYWYNSIQQAFDNFEAYEDQDGNTYKNIKDVPRGTQVSVKYPIPFGDKLPGWAQNALKPYTDSRGGGIRWNPKQLEFMVADPSVSWFGGITISEIVKNGIGIGPWKIYGEQVAQGLREVLGDDVYESSVLYGGYPQEGGGFVETTANTILPGYMKSGLAALGIFRDDRFLDETFVQFKTAYAQWDRNGRIGEPPTMTTAARAAGVMSFIRSIVQFSMPIATSFDPVTRSATAWYAELVDATGGDYKMADKIFAEQWGVDAIALIGSNQKNISGLATTMDDLAVLRKNPELLAKLGRSNTKYAAMLSSGYGDLSSSSEYSTEVAAIFKKLGYPGYDTPITQKKTKEEVAKSVEARRGWFEYQKAQEWRDAKMAEYGIRSTSESMYERSGIKREFDKMVQVVIDDFPSWVTERKNINDEYWDATIPSIQKIVDDENWRAYSFSKGSPKWEEIAYWLEEAKAFNKAYEQQNNTDKRKLLLKQNFAQFHYDFLQTASEEFAAFAYRWLNNMPQLDTEFTVTNG
jgi:hypothetical protein